MHAGDNSIYSFLAITPGGHDLVEGKPMNSISVSHIIKSTAVAAGLPPAGATALRRDAGNDVRWYLILK